MGKTREFSAEIGTYTPTFTIISNLDNLSTQYGVKYTKIGNHVTLFGEIIVDPTAVGQINGRFSLPFSSNFTNIGDVGGSAVNIVSDTLHFRGDSTNNEINVVGVVSETISRNFFFTLNYEIK